MGFLRRILDALGLGESRPATPREPGSVRNPRTGEVLTPRKRRGEPLRPDLQALGRHGLPVIADDRDLAQRLGVTGGQLWWLANPLGKIAHYREWQVPKRTGGTRTISAPRRHLRTAQRWILREVLAKVPAEEPAHGFRRERSIVTNAAPHAKTAVVVNIDLVDFFPSITRARVRGIFQSLGYPYDVAKLLSLLCTAHTKDGGRKRALPQGAPTSPALSNLVCRHLDRRLARLAAQFGGTYTRYADDLTFSGGDDFVRGLARFFNILEKILKEEKFRINWPKRKIRRAGARQRVTGLVVNERPNLPRGERRLLRVMVHSWTTRRTLKAPPGMAAGANVEEWLRGRLGYYAMVDPARGRPLLDKFLGRTSWPTI